jgi:nucleotide-binding universal stress UspA family protein
VVRWAEDNDVDAIVAASHGDPVARAVKLVGTEAAHLARHAPCPVILLPPGTVTTD